MASMRTPPRPGMGLLVTGLATYVLSTVITDGFGHGLFQGMTIALMVGAAYLFGAQWRRDRREPGAERDPEALWLPSQDEDRE